MILIAGWRSTVSQALRELMPTQRALAVEKKSSTVWDFSMAPEDVRVVITLGYLAGKRARDQSDHEENQTWGLNFAEPTLLAEQVLYERPAARVCVLGSWSAVNGSYDENYAASKAKLHRWVQRQTYDPPGQLVCIAPPIIADSAMTRRRPDYPQILAQRPHCCAMDVARAIKAVLFEERPDAHQNEVIYLPATAGPEPWRLEAPTC